MPKTRKSRPAAEGADPTVVTDKVATLFREGRARLAAGDVDAAVRLLEESADLEGERTASVSRAQLVRLLVIRGDLDLALAALERATPKGAGVLWRTVGDLLEPLVAAGRAQEAVACLVGAAESVRGERDFSAAFSTVLDLVQGVRISEEIDRRLLLTLKEAASERLDARLAVERLIAAREVAAGRGEQALLGLAELAAHALRREVRPVERDASTALLAVAIRHLDADVQPPSNLEPERCLHEHLNVDKLGHRLGDRAGDVAALFEAGCDVALEHGRGDAGGVLGRIAAVLRGRAGEVDRAKENLFSAPAESEGARGDRLTIAAWLEGIDPEPATIEPKETAALPADPGADEDVEASGDPSISRSQVELPPRRLVGLDDETAAEHGEVVVALGGAPRLPEGMRWPRCRACSDGLTFVGELRGPAMDRSGHDRALVFACNVAPWSRKYRSRCDAGSRAGGGGTWVWVGAEDPALPPRLAPAGVPVFSPDPLYVGATVASGAGAEASPAGEAGASAREADGEATVERGARQLGGPAPEETPPCPLCAAPLIHALQLGGKGDPALQIANGGTLHVLLCPDGCERGVAFWRSG